MLSLHHISKYYGTHCILNDISLHIEPQTIHIIYGVSGSGKTTLLNILSGHETFEEGSRVLESGLRIHYATQTAHFIDDFTMAENLLFAARDKHQHTILFLSKTLGVDTKLTSYPYQLSGGERQRFNIIRALLDNPHIVILDEPTSALDGSTKHLVLQQLQNITQAALIIVTHDTSICHELPCFSYQLDKGLLSQRLT